MRYLLAILLASLLLSSCTSMTGSAANGRPKVLRMCFSVTAEDPGTAVHRLEPFTRYLEKTLGMRVELIQATVYGGTIEAFRANKVDVASISPFSYVLATQKIPIEAIVMHGTPAGGMGEYTGVLAVPGSSPLRSMDDVVKHARELTISFVDPASASGFLVENAYLQSIGLEPERAFKKVLFSGNHLNSLMSLKSGKVDVAACMERLVKAFKQNGKLGKDEVRVLWVSPPIPNQPIAVSKNLPRPFIEEIRKAFIDMKQKDPEAFNSMMPKAYANVVSANSWVSANDAMFDGLRQMARNVKNLSLLEH